MKKLIFVFILLSVVLALAQTPTITVTSPNGGENWALNSTHPITWRSSGVAGVVNIHLFNGTHYVGVIQNNVQVAAGSFNWVVGNYQGGTAVPGTNYKVRVRKPQTEVLDDSNDPFTISGAAPSGSLTVTSPNGGETWYTGIAYEVRWTSSNISGNMTIKLKKGGTAVKTWTAENTGSSYWNCLGVTDGNDYKIWVENANGSVFDESDRNFTIQTRSVSARPELSIRVESPNGGETWILKVLGVNSATVNWTSNNVPGNVVLTLKKGGNPVRSQTVSNTGSAAFSFAGMAEGEDYRLRIENADNSVSDESNGNFAIKKETLTPVVPKPIQLALAIRDFKLNNGAETTDSPIVTMNHSILGIPTHYRWKNEVMPDWSPWIFYAGEEPKASLPESFGEHTIQFQVKNNNGETSPVSDSIRYFAEKEFEMGPGVLNVCPCRFDFSGWKWSVIERSFPQNLHPNPAEATCADRRAADCYWTIVIEVKQEDYMMVQYGGKSEFEFFAGRQLNEGWSFVRLEYEGQEDNCRGYRITRMPQLGSRDISFRVRVWVDAGCGSCIFKIKKIIVKGPANKPASAAFE
jgi:hypothetical protein